MQRRHLKAAPQQVVAAAKVGTNVFLAPRIAVAVLLLAPAKHQLQQAVGCQCVQCS
jgi:hypothetical protein